MRRRRVYSTDIGIIQPFFYKAMHLPPKIINCPLWQSSLKQQTDKVNDHLEKLAIIIIISSITVTVAVTIVIIIIIILLLYYCIIIIL